MIDLSLMKGIRVDLASRTVRAQAGVRLGDLDRETQAFGLAVPAGIVTHTGLAGLTLGGGIGWLMRRYGLTIDQLLSVDLVTADGELVKASAQENSDLFWGIRGAGGNFGIVTEFEVTVQVPGAGVSQLRPSADHGLDRPKQPIFRRARTAAFQGWPACLSGPAQMSSKVAGSRGNNQQPATRPSRIWYRPTVDQRRWTLPTTAVPSVSAATRSPSPTSTSPGCIRKVRSTSSRRRRRYASTASIPW